MRYFFAFQKLLYCYIVTLVTQKLFSETVNCYLLFVICNAKMKSEVRSLREWSLSSYENLSLCSPCGPWIFLVAYGKKYIIAGIFIYYLGIEIAFQNHRIGQILPSNILIHIKRHHDYVFLRYTLTHQIVMINLFQKPRLTTSTSTRNDFYLTIVSPMNQLLQINLSIYIRCHNHLFRFYCKFTINSE